MAVLENSNDVQTVSFPAVSTKMVRLLVSSAYAEGNNGAETISFQAVGDTKIAAAFKVRAETKAAAKAKRDLEAGAKAPGASIQYDEFAKKRADEEAKKKADAVAKNIAGAKAKLEVDAKANKARLAKTSLLLAPGGLKTTTTTTTTEEDQIAAREAKIAVLGAEMIKVRLAMPQTPLSPNHSPVCYYCCFHVCCASFFWCCVKVRARTHADGGWCNSGGWRRSSRRWVG